MAYILDDDGRGNYFLVQPPNANKTPLRRPSGSTMALPRLTVGSDNIYMIGRTAAQTYSGATSKSSAPAAKTTTAPAGMADPNAALMQSQRAAAAAAAASAAAAEAKARKAENEGARSQAQRDVENLNAQITANLSKKATNENALSALGRLVGGGKGSHAATRDNALKMLDEALGAKLAQLQKTFDLASGDFAVNLRDNEKSESDASFTNIANRAREKQDLVTQALSQGAGESDVLKSQLQALRNWSVNQGDINRSFFDTRTSINAGITDLNTATQQGRMNEELSTNMAKADRWDDFYESMASSYSDMANLDQSNYLLSGEISAAEKQRGYAEGVLNWLNEGKSFADYETPRLETMAAAKAAPYESKYADLAAQMTGSTWTNPGLSNETKNWEGMAQSQTTLTNTQPWNAQDNTESGTPTKKRPEGATLRRW